MAEPPPSPHRRPTWVKVSGIVVGILVVIFVILTITGARPGGGGHGPGMHGGLGITEDVPRAEPASSG